MSELGLMCLIALSEPARLDSGTVREALGRTAPRSDIAVEARDADVGESGLSVKIDRREYAVAALTGGIPQSLHDAALRSPVGWRGRAGALESDRAFVAAAAAEPLTGLGLVRAQAVALTRLAAALAETLPALALIWVSGGSAASPERLVRAPGEILEERWPVDIWIGYRMLAARHAADPGGETLTGARSEGAADFFGSEIEVIPFATPDRSEPLRIALSVSRHLMGHGTRIQDGQRIQVHGSRPVNFARRPGRDGSPGVIRLTADAGEPQAT